MVKLRRIGHATFETPDLDRMIDYYTEVLGLVLVEREKDRAFLATQVGLLAIQLNKADAERGTMLSFEVAPNSDFGALARELEKDGIKSELRNDSIPGIGQVLTFQGQQGHHDRAVQGLELSRQASAASRRRAAQARPHCLGRRRSEEDRRVLQQGAGLSRLRLDLRLLRLHALQFRSSHREFHPRHRGQDASHGVRAERLHPFAEFLRPVRAKADSDHLGAAAARAGPQHRHLSPQSGRSGHRILLRARQDGRRGARLFRAAALAPGHAATAEDLGSRQDQHLGPAADAGFPPGARRGAGAAGAGTDHAASSPRKRGPITVRYLHRLSLWIPLTRE